MISAIAPLRWARRARRALVASSLVVALAACSSGSIDDSSGNGDDSGVDPTDTGGSGGDSRVTPATDTGGDAAPGRDTGAVGDTSSASTDSGTPVTDTASPDTCATDGCGDPCFDDGDGAYCGDSIGGPAGKVYHCKGKKTDSIEDCPEGCSHNPPGVPDTCAGALACASVQWWNSALTYGPYMSSGWWDTDLAVSTHTKVQLRHASKLDKHGVYGWGFMPEFTDQVTGKRFRFLHLQPADQYANVDGTIYPAGFVVGLSGGDSAETGLGPYSTGAHLCVQTLEEYRACFPTGKDPCK